MHLPAGGKNAYLLKAYNLFSCFGLPSFSGLLGVSGPSVAEYRVGVSISG
jgi:hypothetical protein